MTFDQDFKEKVKEFIEEMEITYVAEEFDEIVKFAKRITTWAKENQC